MQEGEALSASPLRLALPCVAAFATASHVVRLLSLSEYGTSLEATNECIEMCASSVNRKVRERVRKHEEEVRQSSCGSDPFLTCVHVFIAEAV